MIGEEIENGSIVVVMLGDRKPAGLDIPDNILAVVVKKYPDGNFEVRTNNAGRLKVPGKMMIDLGKIGKASLKPRQALRENFPDVIMSLALQVHGLKQQVVELRRQLEEVPEDIPFEEEVEEIEEETEREAALRGLAEEVTRKKEREKEQ